MMKTLFRLTALLAVLACLAIWAGLRSFHVFLAEDLVAVVRCEPAPDGVPYRFLIEVTQREGPAPGRREKFPMSGDQWSIGGDLLKWDPWLTALGVKSLHKLTRLESRYLAADRERSGPRCAYDLNGGSSPVWRFLHRFGAYLPWVDAVYGSATYTDAVPGGRWGVYVTHSGYLVRRLR